MSNSFFIEGTNFLADFKCPYCNQGVELDWWLTPYEGTYKIECPSLSCEKEFDVEVFPATRYAPISYRSSKLSMKEEEVVCE